MKRASRVAIIVAAIAAAAVVAGILCDGRALIGKSVAVHRPAAVAGSFYPAEAKLLRGEVTRRLAQAKGEKVPGDLVALIAPHAGYVYSAGVAASAYKQLEGKRFDTVVIVGPGHRVPVKGAALSTAAYWDTPLGSVPIDRDACDALKKAGAEDHDEAHAQEHAIEVQVPFLQVVLKDFTLVPILLTDFSEKNCATLAKGLAELARKQRVLLIASTDLSHYPNYDNAVRVDTQTLKAIETLDAARVAKACQPRSPASAGGLETALCGEGPVRTVLMAARLLGADKASVLHYANSGDVPGSSRGRVVGYGAVAITRPARLAVKPPEGELTEAQQARLLSLARTAIEEFTKTGASPRVEEKDPALQRFAAVFVTLRKHGELRGCIGSLEPQAPLYRAVRSNAIAACSRDPRFPAVTRDELDTLELEISVLSPLRQVKRAEEIQMGRHGVVVANGVQRGVFLPQVATETGWSREEFLNHLCAEKAGLPEDAWRHGASMSVFTVQAFSSPAPAEQSHGTTAK